MCQMNQNLNETCSKRTGQRTERRMKSLSRAGPLPETQQHFDESMFTEAAEKKNN